MKMNQEIGLRIRQARELAKKSQREVATLTNLAPSTILRYENGTVERLKMPVIEAIANALNVDADWIVLKCDVMSHHANKTSLRWSEPLDYAYAMAHEFTQRNVCKLLDIPHVMPDEPVAHTPREMIVYDDSAAAGSPLYAESSYERMAFPVNEIPNGADFGIRICGDSMEPTIHSGSIVWVHKQLDIHDGEVGIFMLGDGAVCKRARTNGDDRIKWLESDNPAYKPITGGDLEGFRVVGKVFL